MHSLVPFLMAMGRSWSRLSRGASEFSKVGLEMGVTSFFLGLIRILGLARGQECVPSSLNTPAKVV